MSKEPSELTALMFYVTGTKPLVKNEDGTKDEESTQKLIDMIKLIEKNKDVELNFKNGKLDFNNFKF